MRKIAKTLLLLLLALLIILSLSGCMMGTSSAEKLTVLEMAEADGEGQTADAAGYADDLDGLCRFMEDNGAVIGDDTYPAETSYSEIGAAGGKRYRFTYNGKTVQAEFYEFDPDSLSDTARDYLAQAREQGQITVLSNTVPARAGDDDRFMMLYIDSSKEAANETQRQKVTALFDSFCAAKSAGA